MLDRASTFADSEIIKLLQTEFVPVAIDQAYQRRQQDTEGDFYRQIAGQGPRNNFEQTTQGFYVATAAGQLLLYNNNRDPAKLRRLLQQKLNDFDAQADTATELHAEKRDPRYNVAPPAGGLVLRVRAKVLDGYDEDPNRWQQIFQTALARDNLWISKGEHESLVRGQLPEAVKQRIARYHLVDNTRGEPPMWKPDEIRRLDMTLDDGRLSGLVHLETASGDRGYQAQIKGVVDVRDSAVVRFDVVALGQYWGEGRFTQGAPDGKFPFAVSFAVADGSDVGDRVPPQGSRGWVEGYLR